MNIDESRSSVNFTPAAQVPATYGMARNITSITVHHWGELGQDFDTVTNFLCNNSKPTSAHFVAEAGRVACIVSPPDAAWHAGNAEGNATSIGIECRPEATDGDYQTVAELVAYLRAKYGPLPLHPHSFWFNTACPGVWDLARLDSLSSAGIAAQGTITTQEDDMGTVDAITDQAMQNLATMVRGQVTEALADVTKSVAFQEQFSVKMLEEIAAKTGVTVDSAAIAADIRAQLAAQIGGK
jgi:hypothetical protein